MTERTVAGIDQNDVKSLLAVSSADGESIVVVWADPVTHALLVKLVGAGGGTVTTITDGTTTVTDATTIDFTSGATVTNLGGGVAGVAITGGSGSGFQIPTGTVNGSNQTFVFVTAPNAIVVDGATLQKTEQGGVVNWTGTTTITMLVAPNESIFSVA